MMPRALLSVYDKTGLTGLAAALADLGWEIVASGGTEKSLVEAGIPVTPVQQLTAQPEMLAGRVKTLHPAIHAGILARDRLDDMDELARHGYAPINLVVCNLYPFQQTIAQPGIALQDALEQIDIGGVTLLRAAAKNFFRVVTLCDPADYSRVIAALKATGAADLALRRDLAVKAFAHTRDYDTAIHAFLSQNAAPAADDADSLPPQLSFAVHAVDVLRYGENPHQSAGYYSRQAGQSPFGARQYGGKQLSYNNILDLDAAWRAISSFHEPTVVIVKHLTPTGIASAATLSAAYPYALDSDPVSAFGGVIAVNRPVDDAFVTALGTLFIEAIAAPDYTPAALAALMEKRQNCRIMQIPQPFEGSGMDIRSVHGGLLIQRYDTGDPAGTLFRTVTERAPTPEEMTALQFAWKAVQHVKSNAIVLAHPGYTVGVGGGLPSRVDAVALAVKKAGSRAGGAVLASDAFFPFPDGVELAIQAGVTAIIQPGGSIRDTGVIEAANRAGVAMIFTGTRHFRH
ncbi:MAG: bifunctional phosphoribosylaminoimidazolecarboxamide formyltransferase/IMP cyclohydrolase [Anaerolineae bacterium]|nr:bifunctional phosphoribosylaminoimidazolecarboxamide formyltransferase/IMP cyclohydrolase [Anaerolineae bacterium]